MAAPESNNHSLACADAVALETRGSKNMGDALDSESDPGSTDESRTIAQSGPGSVSGSDLIYGELSNSLCDLLLVSSEKWWVLSEL